MGLVPRLRAAYRERLVSLHLDTLPALKHRLQSRIYRCLLERQRRRAGRTRTVDGAARHGRRLLPRPGRHTDADATTDSGSSPAPAAMAATEDACAQDCGAERGERGYRRRKLAAMAGSLYRSGQAAVIEMRESYAQVRGRGLDDAGQESTHIPGAFPDVAIASQGDEQMVLFPSYAKRHARGPSRLPVPEVAGARDDDDWWRRQVLARADDERAIVDVDVRGWIYNPHTGPMTRRNRILIGLARQLSGISAPSQCSPPPPSTQRPTHEELRDADKIAHEAAFIERRGLEEKRVAVVGGYSEPPPDGPLVTSAVDAARRARRRSSQTPESAPGSPMLAARLGCDGCDMTDAELAVANANLMARVAPFLTNPLVALPITIFFYNETRSQSLTVMTNDAGHFMVRAPLDFVPTHVRVLANEKLSATHEVHITEPRGVSLISDVDDTIKHSNIAAGAREIFRNTFVRDLADLTVDGVGEWYGRMHHLGVGIHYCSNSPWQLFPVLASFFKLGGLPPGSLHLKQYSGMMQGIFEPVAERKKSTLNRLVADFPHRRFLLVGDSGEADLEVYTDLALANPGRILAVFIRDVTTPERTGYFDAPYDAARRKASSRASDDATDGAAWQKPPPPPPARTTPTGPAMGTLIDLSAEPEAAAPAQANRAAKVLSATDLLAGKKAPPPRPAKPAALRSQRSSANLGEGQGAGPGSGLADGGATAPLPPPRRPVGAAAAQPPPPQSARSSSRQAADTDATDAAPPPLPRRRGVTPSLRNLSPRLFGHRRSDSDVADLEPLPPPAAPPPATPPLGFSYRRPGSRSSGSTPSESPTLVAQGANRKLELWRRRLARAHEVLDAQGVRLYTWRRGQDVEAEAVGIVSRALEEMARADRGKA